MVPESRQTSSLLVTDWAAVNKQSAVCPDRFYTVSNTVLVAAFLSIKPAQSGDSLAHIFGLSNLNLPTF